MEFFNTEPIVVITRETQKDDLGEVISTSETEYKTDALVCPVSTQDISAERPNGDKVIFNVHFKKDWNISLAGAYIEIRGERYRVNGNPQKLTDDNCPTPFNLSAQVVKCDG